MQRLRGRAVVGLLPAALLVVALAGCQDQSVLGPREAAPSASASGQAETARAQRLQRAGVPGMRAGVNLPDQVGVPAHVQSAVESLRPEGFTRPAQRPELRVRDSRFGAAARPSEEVVNRAMTRGGEAFKRKQGGDLSAASSSWWYGGASWVDWWWYFVDFYSWTEASKNLSYIDVIGYSFVDGWYMLGLYNYAYDASFAGVWWSYDTYWYGQGYLYEQYGDHWVSDPDLYYGYDNFFTYAYQFNFY